MRKTNENGITLIVLIITVIIMLILAGVTIDIIIDESILQKTRNVVNDVLEHENTMSGIKDEVRNQIKPGNI